MGEFCPRGLWQISADFSQRSGLSEYAQHRTGISAGGRLLAPPSRMPRFRGRQVANSADDLAREVYGVLGMPIDALSRGSALQKIAKAAEANRPFLISTPNVNFMAACQTDSAFRELLMCSDLCAADGMPIVWISRLLGIPIKERVSGSDLFDTIRSNGSSCKPLRVFLFGGSEGVAETVSEILNSGRSGIRCVGWHYPGYGTVSEMSSEGIINKINESDADLLAVFLNAKKAQAWLLMNHHRLQVPVRGQFGSTINYQAGTVRRAPRAVQNLGLEWLWRIKEEPYLWRRYFTDALSLIGLVVFRVLPIAIRRWRHVLVGTEEQDLLFSKSDQENLIVVSLIGQATANHAANSAEFFRKVRRGNNGSIVIDLSQTQSIDTRFFGLLLMLRKQLHDTGRTLSFTGATKQVTRDFYLNGFEFLLTSSLDPSLVKI